ncbi:hypothetical protein K8U54_19265 [Pseudomonas fulva]|uniref:hypothetical protein n=1 Tax=Pseudomonas fulva TaxID=47880 RepID=UPI00201DC9A5|nr:hypothetical protein [Pseudomonas fulva]UQY33831.1 hypothetical protein K8U54_19265 [Pseudomonas fulva]
MAELKLYKVVSALPQTLEADSIYLVRAGDGFDLYTTNHGGTIISYKANYQPKHANLTSLAGLTGSANKMFYFTAESAMALADLTVFGRLLNAAADAPAARSTLGLGTAAIRNVGTGGFDLVERQALGTAAYLPVQAGRFVSSLTQTAVALEGSFGFGGQPGFMGTNPTMETILENHGISKMLRIEDNTVGYYSYCPLLHAGGSDTWWQLQVHYLTGAVQVAYGINKTRNGRVQVITEISEEFGTNANGDFWRFTDGRLEMIRPVTISATAGAYGETNVQLPAVRSSAYRAVILATVAGVGSSESYDVLKLQADFLAGDTVKLRWKFSVTQSYVVWISVKGRWK